MAPPTASRTHETDRGWLRIRTPSGETSILRRPIAELTRASSTRVRMTPATGMDPSRIESAPTFPPLKESCPSRGRHSTYPVMPGMEPIRACSPASVRATIRNRWDEAPTSRREDNRSSRRRADNRAAEAARVIKGSTSRMTAIVEVSL